jgi:hypothetical protein
MTAKSRRRSLRRAVEVECAVRSELWEGELKLRAANLSTDGLWLETPLPLARGQELIVAFRPPLAEGHELVWASTEVVRAGVYGPSSDGSARPGIGVVIRYCSPEHEQLLARALRGCPPRLPPSPRRVPPPLPRGAQS